MSEHPSGGSFGPDDLLRYLKNNPCKAKFGTAARSMAYQVAADLRKSALQADDWGHELREIALDNWLRDHPAIADDVCLAIACIGMRGDAR